MNEPATANESNVVAVYSDHAQAEEAVRRLRQRDRDR